MRVSTEKWPSMPRLPEIAFVSSLMQTNRNGYRYTESEAHSWASLFWPIEDRRIESHYWKIHINNQNKYYYDKKNVIMETTSFHNSLRCWIRHAALLFRTGQSLKCCSPSHPCRPHLLRLHPTRNPFPISSVSHLAFPRRISEIDSLPNSHRLPLKSISAERYIA